MDKSYKFGNIYYLFVMYYIIYMYKDITVHIENIYLTTFYLKYLSPIKYKNTWLPLFLQIYLSQISLDNKAFCSLLSFVNKL